MAVYKYKSSKNIISLLYDEGIKSSDSEGRVAGWCLRAIKTLRSTRTRFKIPVKVMIKDYTISIPEELDQIHSIEMNGLKLHEIYKHKSILRDVSGYERSYTISNGKINFSITNVEVVINGSYYPIEFDPVSQSYFPLYPDKDSVEDYLVLYCTRRMMLRGYNHPMYSFKELNHQTNINMLVERAKKSAKIEVDSMSLEERRIISDTIIRPDVDFNLDITNLFN